MIWDCSIPGKKDTLWEGGIYRVRILFPPTYPIEPPMVTFTPPLFHPNIFTGGQVCLSLLKQQKDWAPSITIGDILLGLQDLLATVSLITANITLYRILTQVKLSQIRKTPRIGTLRNFWIRNRLNTVKGFEKLLQDTALPLSMSTTLQSSYSRLCETSG